MPDGAPSTDIDDDPFPRPLQNWREQGHGRRIAPDAVWAAARDDYLAGLSAPEVCARHDLRLTTLRDRAAREGWRRIDQPWAPRNRLDPDDEGVELEARVGSDLNKVELRELSYIAMRRMMRAVLRGDAAGALRWRRVRDAMDAEDAKMERLGAQLDAILKARRGCARSDERGARHSLPDPDAPDASDASDASDGVFRGADAPRDPDFPDPESRDIVAP
jgi:hypothetical protein